ncbi:MAG TPA: CPBP family intramembrane glutamic endopeptidase [Lysobacter sp.]
MPTPPRSPTAALVALLAWAALSALWFVSPLFPMQALRELQVATGGWLSVTLIASTGIGLVQLAIVFGPGRQSARDVGWHTRAIATALAGTATLWALMHAGTLAWAFASGTAVSPAPGWAEGAGIALGPLIAQLLGTALMEETAFRGYLWPQLVLRLRAVASARVAAIAGLLLSQAVFALLHVPVLLYRGLDGGALAGTLLMLFAVGIVFAFVYAATGNLWLAVGTHALANAPTLVLAPQGAHPTLWLMGGVVLMAAVAWSRRRAPPKAAARTTHANADGMPGYT